MHPSFGGVRPKTYWKIGGNHKSSLGKKTRNRWRRNHPGEFQKMYLPKLILEGKVKVNNSRKQRTRKYDWEKKIRKERSWVTNKLRNE